MGTGTSSVANNSQKMLFRNHGSRLLPYQEYVQRREVVIDQPFGLLQRCPKRKLRVLILGGDMIGEKENSKGLK